MPIRQILTPLLSRYSYQFRTQPALLVKKPEHADPLRSQKTTGFGSLVINYQTEHRWLENQNL
jgi:hypothetical protein